MGDVQKIGSDPYVGKVKKRENLDNLGDRSVVPLSGQTSKKLLLSALIVGAVVCVAIVGFGAMGLLQSHQLIHLPQSLASAIGTIGHSPPFWSLWAMVVGGTLGAGGLVALGMNKIHRAKESHSEDFVEIFESPYFPSVDQAPKPAEESDAESKVTFDFEDELNTTQQAIIGRIPSKETSAASEKYYQTRDTLTWDSASIGDYRFIPFYDQIKLLVIKDSKKNLTILVRESTRFRGEYRLIHKQGQGFRESSLLFSAAQLATMVRHASNPQNGVRVSGLTRFVRDKTGLIIFTTEEPKKTYFLVNRKGALEETPEQHLLELIQRLNPRAHQ